MKIYFLFFILLYDPSENRVTREGKKSCEGGSDRAQKVLLASFLCNYFDFDFVFSFLFFAFFILLECFCLLRCASGCLLELSSRWEWNMKRICRFRCTFISCDLLEFLLPLYLGFLCLEEECRLGLLMSFLPSKIWILNPWISGASILYDTALSFWISCLN